MYAIVMVAGTKRRMLKNRFQLENQAKQCCQLLFKWHPYAEYSVVRLPGSMNPQQKAERHFNRSAKVGEA